MKRSIPRSLLNAGLVQNAAKSDDPDQGDETPDANAFDAIEQSAKASGGVGSAWKRGALSQMEDDLSELRSDKVNSIIQGRQIIELSAEQVVDEIGSDRRPDWQTQEAFKDLMESIKRNGQDTPIQVMPRDKDWAPDLRDGTSFDDQSFVLISGRRRCEACRILGIKVRAIVKQPVTDTTEQKFELLLLRFRENEEREDLSPFERMVSIGEMYEELAAKAADKKLTAVAFAERIGIHESLVSRARSTYRNCDKILNAFKNPYDWSFKDLQNALAKLSEKASPAPKAAANQPKKTKDLVYGKTRIGGISQSKKDLLIAIDLKENKAFGDYLITEIPDLYARFVKEEHNK